MWVKAVIFTLAFSAISCGEHEGFRSYYGEAQGTTFSIKYDYPMNELEDEFDSILNSMDAHFSTYEEGSMISQVNDSEEPVRVDEIFIDLWEKCWNININTNGFFDPTLEPVLALYNFDIESELTIDSARVKETLKQTGMHLINIRNNELIKKNKEVKLNFNAVAGWYP